MNSHLSPGKGRLRVNMWKSCILKAVGEVMKNNEGVSDPRIYDHYLSRSENKVA